jgi:26S proteasome regulatory subunit N7
MSDPQYASYPDLALSQHIFQLTNPHSTLAVQQLSLQKLQNAIKEHKMAPLYRYLAHPAEGILNAPGEGSSSHAGDLTLRRTSSHATNILATRRPSLRVNLPWDEQLYDSLESDNKEELEKIQTEEDDAVEKAGETEIQAAKGKRGEFWARVGDKVRLV